MPTFKISLTNDSFRTSINLYFKSSIGLVQFKFVLKSVGTKPKETLPTNDDNLKYIKTNFTNWILRI